MTNLTIFQTRDSFSYSNTITDLTKGSIRVLVTPTPYPSMLYVMYPSEEETIAVYIDETNDSLAYEYLAKLQTYTAGGEQHEEEPASIHEAKQYLRVWGKYCSIRNSCTHKADKMYERGDNPQGGV